MKEQKERPYVECGCGARVYGKSKVHAESLLQSHKNSKKHKELMEIKERRAKG